MLGFLGTLIGSWVPFQFQGVDHAKAWAWLGQLPPLDQISKSDLVANFWLAIPLACGLSGWWALHRGPQQIRLLRSLAVLLVVLLTGLTAEIGQVFCPDRTPSCLDILAQGLGALATIVAWPWIGTRLEKLVQCEGHPSDRRWVAGLVCIGIILWSVFPLDVVTSPSELARKLVNSEWIPFSKWLPTWSENVYQWLASLALGVPFGLWIAFYGSSKSPPWSWLTMALVAILLGVLPEMLQLAIRSRVASATDALFGATGALLAVWVSSQWRPQRQAPTPSVASRASFHFLLVLAALLINAWVAWMPFDLIETTAELKQTLLSLKENPFRQNAGSDLLFGLTAVRQIFLAALLGGLIGWWPLNDPHADAKHRRRQRFVCLLGLLFGLLMVELGQLMVISRNADGVGLAIRWLGGLGGWWVGSNTLGMRREKTDQGSA